MHAYCPYAMHFSADTVERLVLRLSKAKLDAPTHPDRFSPRQVVAHLRFFEDVAQERIRAAVAESGSPVEDWDEEADVARNNYDSLDPIALISVWRQLRVETIALLESLPPEAWKRSVVHPTRGEMTIEDIANMLIAHDLYHVAQLTEAMG